MEHSHIKFHNEFPCRATRCHYDVLKKKHTPAQFVQLYVILQGTVLFPGMKAVHVSSRQLICQFTNFFGSNRRLLRFYILHRYLSFYNEYGWRVRSLRTKMTTKFISALSYFDTKDKISSIQIFSK